jgi:hypothetical protein
MSDKRRLPVLQPASDDQDEDRPPWHWTGIGGVALLLFFLPLSMLASSYAKRVLASLVPAGNEKAAAAAVAAMSPSDRIWLSIVVVIGPMLALAVSSLLSGMLVGRFGGDAGKREALVGGLGAAAILAVVSLSQSLAKGGSVENWLLTAAVVTGLAGISAYGGARLGLRLRP